MESRNSMIKLSIIVPIYNVEQYLRKCVDSLLAQDLPSSVYEIILVDDGSPDACPQICDEYAAEHDNIRVIHRKNGGLSAARNSGIEVAQGEYICFVDSDDYWEENVLGSLMAQVEREKLDVLRFRYQNVRLTSEGMNELTKETIVRDEARKEHYEVFQPYKRDYRLDNDYSDEVTDGVTFLNTRMSTACYAVMFIVRRALLFNDLAFDIGHLTLDKDECLFTQGIFFEDTDWTPRMLVKAQRVASTNTVVYNYLQREGSITNAVNRSKQKKVLDDKMHLIITLQQQANDLQKSGRYNRWYRDMISDTVVSIIGMLSVEFYAEKDAYLKQLKQLNIYPLEPKSSKAKLINLSPRLAVELLHFKNR